MTKALDAAIRAARTTAYWMSGTDDERFEGIICAALRAALPAEPDVEVIEAMARADAEITGDWEWEHFPERDKAIYRKASLAAYRALRAHLLGEDA